MKFNPAQAAKAIIGGYALAITALQPEYGKYAWFVAVTAVYGTLAIYFSWNAPSATALAAPVKVQ